MLAKKSNASNPVPESSKKGGVGNGRSELEVDSQVKKFVGFLPFRYFVRCCLLDK